jgi:hypothetical protein
MKLRCAALLVLIILIVGCTLPTSVPTPFPATPTASTAPTITPTGIPTASPTPSFTVHRIAIRTVDGSAEFYDTVSGEKFIPRGVNYVDFAELTPGKLWEDYIFGAGTYRPEKVRQAFQRLAAGGYNTVRLFFDHCFSGPSCIGNQEQDGLNPVFLDHIVEVMQMAAEEGVYLLLTANGVPADGGYWARYDQQFQQQGHFGFDQFFGNGYYLHAAGVDMQAQYWRDLMGGLAARHAPFDVVLGWQLQNEYWLFNAEPPLSLDEGLVTISNGQLYDMADPAQKTQMATDGALFWMETLIPIIKGVDPQALVTVGFFPPNFPNDLDLVPERYRDTASLIQVAPVDFWDFHLYPGPGDLFKQYMGYSVENFGMAGYQAKPVLMGEVGAFRHLFSNVDFAASRMQEWMAESCNYAFDGWLVWEYYNRPADDAVWGLENATLFDALAPLNAPDACAMTPLTVANLAFGKTVTASASLPDGPPENAVDGSDAAWNSGGGPSQWIEIDLGQPTAITRIRLHVAQYPEGDTIHQIRVRGADGEWVEIHRFAQHTTGGEWLEFTPESPLPGVQVIRIDTLESPSWVSWAEIEIFGE